MLVTVEFPNKLVITGAGEIEIRNRAEIGGAEFLSVKGIAAPGDRGRKSDRGAEKGKAAGENFCGEAADFVSIGGTLERFGDGGRAGKRERTSGEGGVGRKSIKVVVGYFLTEAEGYFVRTA